MSKNKSTIKLNISTLEGGGEMKIYWNGQSKNIIGTKIKELRRKKGLTQKALAEQLQLQGYEFSDLTVLRI